MEGFKIFQKNGKLLLILTFVLSQIVVGHVFGEEDLVLYYNFNGDANDYSGNNYHGKIMGNMGFVDGISGQALDFDGIDDYVYIGDLNAVEGIQKITFSAWIYPRTVSFFYPVIVSKYDSARQYGGLEFAIHNSEELKFIIADTSDRRTIAYSIEPIPLGQWHYVVGIFDGSQSYPQDTVKIYLDGVEQELVFKSTDYPNDITPDTINPLRIGALTDINTVDYYFDGIIDEIKIYSKVLSLEEILAYKCDLDMDGSIDIFCGGNDCDNSRSNVYPGAPEECDGLDNNCDGAIDEGYSSITLFSDFDNDNYGNEANMVVYGSSGEADCPVPIGFSSVGGDCDDTNPDANPSLSEACDGIDNNCDGAIDEEFTLSTFYRDFDNDLYGNTANMIVLGNMGAIECPTPEGYSSDYGDCDDSDPNANPGLSELCDGIDNNCDGAIDEEFTLSTFYRDFDNDLYGNAANMIVLGNMGAIECPTPEGYSSDYGDCDDSDPSIYPDAPEICDEKDNQCPGNDGYGSTDEGYICETNPPTIIVKSPGTNWDLIGIDTLIVFSIIDDESGIDTWKALLVKDGFETALCNGIEDGGFSCGPVSPGIYNLIVIAHDRAGNEAIVNVPFIVYDPNGGFATGGGWFYPDGEEGCLSPNNKATFGFVAKYNKGIAVGNLEFQYHDRENGINLKSKSIDWLVLSGDGAAKAQFKGTATINGEEELHTFKVVVYDINEPGEGYGKFEIRIFTGVIEDVENSNPVYKAKNILRGGNIKIKKK